MNHAPASEALENGHQARKRVFFQLAARRQLVRDLTQRPGAAGVDEWQQPAVDEEELPIAVAVAQGPEAFRPQRDGVVEPYAVASLQSDQQARDQ